MTRKIVTIAVDVMGAQSPDVVFRGLTSACQENSSLRFLLYGKEEILAPVLCSYPVLSQVSTLCSMSLSVSMDDKVGVSVRKRRKTSMWGAVCACRDGDADVVISGGNTAVLVAFSRFGLGLLPGFSHPVLMTELHNGIEEDVKKKSFSLYAMDVGGHYEASHKQLIKMAFMGVNYLHSLHKSPITVQLLNMATEEKGTPSVLLAHSFFQDFPCKNMKYKGFVEPSIICSAHDLKSHTLVVTDGFSGNIFVKSLEQLGLMVHNLLLSLPFWKRLFMGAFMHKNSMRKSVEAMLFGFVQGVRGVVFKMRESSNEETYKNAALQGYYTDKKVFAMLAAQATETNEIVKEAFKEKTPPEKEETWSKEQDSSEDDALQPSL